MQKFQLNEVIPMFLLWISIISVILIVIKKKKLNKKISIIVLIVSVILGGIVLNAIPNAVMPIQQVLSVVITGGNFISIIPVIVILVILLISTVFIGRIFCGYACPLGALQEIISLLNFKSDLKKQKGIKFAIKTDQKWGTIIRWVFFGLLIILALVWSVALLQLINPFLGFSNFLNPIVIIFQIPLITLYMVVIVSIFIYRPWCRFFCPFGAIASLTSRVSRNKLNRTDACTGCGLCEKICPTQEAFRDSSKAECYLCNRCVEICPVDAINFKKK